MNFHPMMINAVVDHVNQASLKFQTLNRGFNPIVDKVNQDLCTTDIFEKSPAETGISTIRYMTVAGLRGVGIIYLYGAIDDPYLHSSVLVADVRELEKPGMLVTQVGSSTTPGIMAACAARAAEDLLPIFIESQNSKWVSGCTFLSSDDFLGSSSAKTTTPPPLLEPEISWLKSAYDLIAAGKVPGALRIMYWGIEDLFATRNFLLLNHALTRVDLKRLTPEVMIGLIRSTFRGRLVLPAWASLLNKIKEEMKQRNVPDWERLLVGLEAEGRR